MTVAEAPQWPLDPTLYMAVMQQGPRSSSTLLLPRENLLHTSMLAGRPAQRSPQVGDAAPDFRLLAVDGTTRTLSDFAGRPLVLAFSRALTPTLVCPFSMRAMVELKDTYDEFDAAGVQLAVVFPASPEGSQEILAHNQLGYPAYSDPTWEAFTAYGSGHLLFGPLQMYAVVDAHGIVSWLWRPEDDRNEKDAAGVLNMPLPSEVLAAALAVGDR